MSNTAEIRQKLAVAPASLDRFDVYDLLLASGVVEPAVVVFDSLHVVGHWVNLATITRQKRILVSKSKGVEVLGQGSSWEEALRAAGIAG